MFCVFMTALCHKVVGMTKAGNKTLSSPCRIEELDVGILECSWFIGCATIMTPHLFSRSLCAPDSGQVKKALAPEVYVIVPFYILKK